MKKRQWIVASTFVWCLAGAVAIAAYSGQPPLKVAESEHDHASHAGQPHIETPATSSGTPTASGASAALTEPGLTTPASAAPGANTNALAGRENRIVPREIAWEETFEGAMQKARAQNKPILIDFYADWCGPCKLMDERTYPDRQVIAQSQNWVTVKVNGEKRPDVMQAYGISGYPTLVFAKGNGQPMQIVSAYQDAPQLVQQMQDAFSTWSNTKNKA